MERTNLNILFFIRKNKIKKNGKLPIFLRLTVNGERAEFVLERDVLEEDWDTNTERAKGKGREAKVINDYLDHVKLKIREIKIGLEEKKESVRLENIKNIFQGVKSTERTLLSIIEEHNVSFKELIGKDYTKGTYTKYMTLKKHIEGFIQHKYQKNDLVLSELNTELVRGFEHYLKTINNLQNNTALKYIKALKKIVRVALSNNWIDQDPFSGIKYHTDEVKIDFLTNDELEKIRKKDFHIDRVNQVRDVYVFCCYTGLAFIDVFNLQKTDIIKKNGKYWIEKERQKTKVLYIVPLLPPAMNIVRKYENHPLTIKKDRLLPVLSNQKMNCYLKEIADLCGIRKKLTTHTARHTFATTVTLGNQVSMEVVAKMLGHTNTKMTAKYARVLDTVISKDMEKVFAIY